MSNNQAPEQLYISFDGNSPESLRTIYMQGESQPKKANEYNVSVFNADGTTATGTVAGMISVDIYSPGSDRPETTIYRAGSVYRASKIHVVFCFSGQGCFQCHRIRGRAKGGNTGHQGRGVNYAGCSVAH